MLRLYRETAVLAFKRALKAWPVAFSLIVYAIIFMAAAWLLAPLGLIGGLLLSLVAAACGSGYLYLVLQAVRGLPVRLDDLRRGFSALFGDVISVMFALWIISLFLGVFVQGAGEHGAAILAMIGLAMAFFLNPVPEMIYLGKSRSFALLLDSARFVFANPVAWFLPNLIFALIVLAPTGGLAVSRPGELLLVFSQLFSPAGVAQIFAKFVFWGFPRVLLLPLVLLFLHYVMVFRGLLFEGLTSGGSRRRDWQARL
jgi:hypothetical protein